MLYQKYPSIPKDVTFEILFEQKKEKVVIKKSQPFFVQGSVNKGQKVRHKKICEKNTKSLEF